MLTEHPGLAETAGYNPKEALLDFFDERRDELDTHAGWSTRERDIKEIEFLSQVYEDLKRRGPASIYIKKIIGVERFEIP